MTKKQILKALLEISKGGKILFLGKEGIFTDKESRRFLKKFKLSLTREYEEDVCGVIEHHRLNPLEEEISNRVYDAGIPLYTLHSFEKLISEEINDDELLMGIKLSNDQERILRLLGNEHLSHTLFVKLLKMYRFHEEEEDNRHDRDVIMYTLRRYIKINPNEEDLLYSYLTLRRLATEATDPQLLLALVGFPDFEFMVRGKERVTLRETIARNPQLDEVLIAKLLALRNSKVDRALASNTSISPEVLNILFAKKSREINKALATNSRLDEVLFAQLLACDPSVVALLLVWQPMSLSRLERIEHMVVDERLFALLGANEHLDAEVVEKLLFKENQALKSALCGNPIVKEETLRTLFEENSKETFDALAQNPATPLDILQTLYREYPEDITLLKALAHNPSVPQEILEALFEKENLEINRGLATNASLPQRLLESLKIDTRLQHELAQNEHLANSYEAVLKQQKVMLNI